MCSRLEVAPHGKVDRARLRASYQWSDRTLGCTGEGENRGNCGMRGGGEFRDRCFRHTEILRGGYLAANDHCLNPVAPKGLRYDVFPPHSCL